MIENQDYVWSKPHSSDWPKYHAFEGGIPICAAFGYFDDHDIMLGTKPYKNVEKDEACKKCEKVIEKLKGCD